MRRLGLLIVATAAALIVGAFVFAQVKVPALHGRVNDDAHILTAQQAQQIESALAQFESETTTQIVLLTVPSLQSADIETFGIRVAEAWKIGRKGKDNGAILLVAPGERKVRIEVGYGLEGALTDLESAEIIRNVIVPAFKQGNYYAGIVGGLDGMMKASVGEFKAPEKQPGYARDLQRKSSSILSTIFMIVIFILLISTRTGRFILFTSMMFGGRGGRGGFGGGGGFSGGGGGFGGGGASGSW